MVVPVVVTDETETQETPEPTPEDDHVYDDVIVSIEGTKENVTYDGQKHVAEGYTVTDISSSEYTESDFMFVGTALAELTDAGFAQMGLNSDMFKNKNSRFVNVIFDISDGYIEVSPINAEIEVVGTVDSVEYDGELHTVEGFTFRQAKPENLQLYTRESFEIAAEGSDYAEGTDAGIYPMGLNADSFVNVDPNFNRVQFVVSDGYLEITESDAWFEKLNTLEAETELPEGEINPEGEVTSDGEMTPEGEETLEGEVKPEAEDLTEDTEIPEAETPVQTVVLPAGTVVYGEPNSESENRTELEKEAAVVVLSTDDLGWAELQFEDETRGYVILSEVLTDETPVSEEEIVTMSIPAGVNIREEADGLSAVTNSFEEDIEVTVLDITDGWIKIQLEDGTIGYVFAKDIPSEEEADASKADIADRKVTIFTSRRAVVELGETIEMTSLLEGFLDTDNIAYQWECDKGNGFEPVEGANEATYSYQADVDNLTWDWRLRVYF